MPTGCSQTLSNVKCLQSVEHEVSPSRMGAIPQGGDDAIARRYYHLFPAEVTKLFDQS
jgi:hypothetical protein